MIVCRKREGTQRQRKTKKWRLIMIRREIGGQGAKGFDLMEYIWKTHNGTIYSPECHQWC